MPEGDTLFQAARRLHEAFAGQVIVRFATPLPELKEQGIEGRSVVRARAHGKYVIIELDDGRALLSHLRMQGTWSVLEKRRMSVKSLAQTQRPMRWDDEVTTLIMESRNSVAILRRAAWIELAPLPEIERRLSSLGPDVLAPEFELQAALTLLKSAPELTIAEALLRQSLLAGVGNVYKSEILFMEGQNPFVPVSSLDDATLTRLLERARSLMRRNLSGRRRTTPGMQTGTPYYVYERSGRHCLKCDTTIRMRRQGPLQRSTYFCPECQSVPESCDGSRICLGLLRRHRRGGAALPRSLQQRKPRW